MPVLIAETTPNAANNQIYKASGIKT